MDALSHASIVPQLVFRAAFVARGTKRSAKRIVAATRWEDRAHTRLPPPPVLVTRADVARPR